MRSRIRPIYIDGPLEGQDFPTDSLHVQAPDYGASGKDWYTLSLTADYVTYQCRQFAFHSGGKTVSFWIGSCSPGEPDAVTVLHALCRPELWERAEVADMPNGSRRDESAEATS